MRQFATDKYGSVDDHPYGGGHGMILRVDIVDKAITYAKKNVSGAAHTVLLDAQGTTYAQPIAKRMATSVSHLILVCGHYEGVDERVRELVDEVISLGDYIVTGGEIPAMILIDSIVRLIPGVLSKEIAVSDESFSQEQPLLEHPQYTRPEEHNGKKVPEILLGGNHALISKWRSEKSREKTKKLRIDLIN